MSGDFWAARRVLVTGGAGFLGSQVVRKLSQAGAREVVVPRKEAFDLREKGEVLRLYREARPEVVIHLAGRVGGIGEMSRHPGLFFYENAMMGLHMIEQARHHPVEKFVYIGTVCSYPKHAPVPFREEDLWNGYPEETSAPYGLAKRMLLEQIRAYRSEYGLHGISLVPVNLYGPGDNFDLASSHVIAALIRKCVEAQREGQKRITAWGSGQASREFLYVEDAAEAIVAAAEKYDKADPVNLGSGQETRIKELLELIREITDFNGEIEWDPARPEGQPRRCLDTRRARDEFGWSARTALKDGLARTVAWYREQPQPEAGV